MHMGFVYFHSVALGSPLKPSFYGEGGRFY